MSGVINYRNVLSNRPTALTYLNLFFRKRKVPSHQDTDVESLLLRQITWDLKNAV